MKKIRLDNGLNLEIQDNVMNNMEMLDLLVDLDDGKPYAISRVVGMIFGDQKQKVYDFYREDDGTVPIPKIVDCMKEVMDKMGDAGKNS